MSAPNVPEEPLRILLVDDSDLIRRGIRTILSARPRYSICGEARDGEQGVEKARQNHPDVVLLDVSLPGLGGIEASRSIQKELPATKVLLLSQADGAVMKEQTEEAHADGYVQKDNLAVDLIPAIERLAGGGGKPGAEPKASLRWLQGGGQMGELIRAKDWSKTLVGPVETWSPALRMMVRFLLANSFPQLLWWGPQFCSVYNDAYIPILGVKHPWALGRPVSEVWNEIWHVLKPLIETPFHGGPPTWMEDIPLEVNRHGFVEETHFTIAYSAVPDEAAERGIGGVLATVHEITEQVIAERRVRMLRDLGARSAEPKSSEDACRIIEEILARYPKDVPFALLYLLNEKRDAGQLVCSPGVNPDSEDLKEIRVAAEDGRWPVGEALRNDKVVMVQGLQGRMQDVPQGPWSEPPGAAAIVPIRSNLAHQPVGFMIAGISSRIEFDEKYHGFLELLSSQIATMMANARAYEEERRRTEALAEIDRSKTVFFSNVSHEFRTPLTLMLGPLHDLLASDKGDLSPTAREQLDTVNRNGTRLLRLVNSLLDFSRIQAGRVDAVYQATDLEAFTAELASAFESATHQAGLKLLVECHGLKELVYVDRDMWEKIVLNLISNAFKFTFEGEIAVAIGRVGDEAELRVRDTGVGIPAEEIPKLFERFHRVPNTRSRTYEGSGIGLAMVNELVKLHGGSMSVESTMGQGSTFIVRIPLGRHHLVGTVEDAPTTSSTASAATPYVEEALRWLPERKQVDGLPIEEAVPIPSAPEAISATAERPRVLIADDNADMRQYLSRLLGESYRVEAVADGEAAWEAVRREPPALILSDVMMPNVSGLELLEKVRADSDLKEIPIILLSARAGEESRLEGLASGTDDYLVKPFSARELISRVEAHVKMSQMRQQARREQKQLAEEYETLLNQAPMGIFLIDSEFKLRQVNPVALPEFKKVPNPIGKDFREVTRDLFSADYADEIVEIFRRTLETGIPYATFERPTQRIDRQETGYYDWRVDRIALPEGGYGAVCYFRDSSPHVKARMALSESQERYRQLAETLEDQVNARTQEVERRNTEIVRQAEQLQELSSRLLKIQDDERRRVARELHDSAGQTLTALGMNLALIAEEAKTASPKLAQYARDSEELIQHLHHEIRTTSYLLHPPLLDESGLYSALEWYVQGVMQRSGLEIRLEITREFGRLPRDMELMIFRVVQECLTNVHRHSGSKTASIRCLRTVDEVRVYVEDQGKGIAKQRLAQIRGRGAGVGIVGMKERLRLFGGELRLESDESGTRVCVRIPLGDDGVRQNEAA